MKKVGIIFIMATIIFLPSACVQQIQTSPTATIAPSAPPTLTATAINPTPSTTPFPSPTSTLAYTPTPMGQLFFDDFEGETKDYLVYGLENDQWGIIQIDNNNVLFARPKPNSFIFLGTFKENNLSLTFDFMVPDIPKMSADSWFAILLHGQGSQSGGSYHPSSQYRFFWGFCCDGFTSINFETARQDYKALAKKQRFIQANKWYHIQTEVDDGILTWYINDERWLRAKNTSATSGKVGFSFGNDTHTVFYFDNITVEAFSEK